MLRNKIVFGVCEERVKERLLREPSLTLFKAMAICRAAESIPVEQDEGNY